MSKVLIVGAASIMGASAVAELLERAGEFELGTELEVASFAAFSLSLPEVGVLCRPYGKVRFVLRSQQDLQRALHSALQVAELNKAERLLSLVPAGNAEPEPAPEPEPKQEPKADKSKSEPKAQAKGKAK